MKLPRPQRREQVLACATRVFADRGYSATGLDDVAKAAGISRMILYRLFESKADLYRAACVRAGERLAAATGDELTESTVGALVIWAAKETAEFHLLFHQAAREPEFRSDIDELRAELIETLQQRMLEVIPDKVWAKWAAHLALTVTVEATMTWLEVGSPDPDQAVERITGAVQAVITASVRHS
ncbi:TetR/AcrR family transcriptional regulator [Kibdelosporangium philippinense]|uniref:TetR/AcrR family transcriptional regulator n=1 Tax=Kibdelosporangium philippinense TaxID=211113 RepID=A0ABS8ZCV8_9PSEU|nr:TetR/AcrR family transcriptional regulator [Kibdelosporangium philippinense]MCE7005684.1 TetR/AcrR family transcriptional regulator [Kibdelosporangium philippinense]